MRILQWVERAADSERRTGKAWTCSLPAVRCNLRRRYVRLVDLDERVLAQAVDVGLVVALPGLVADVLAQLFLQRLECRDFGGEALLDLDDVPRGLRLDRADDLAGRGVEDGLVELGEQLAAGDLAEVAAFF